ncbi:condensation domain-containing protein [Micromonospora sp. BRA006-A]|nr:condensation domain-containing protein [Micromonospora sp. BRA006-A]
MRWFELAEPPLIRLHVHVLNDAEYRLTITDCHAVLDGWSLTSLIAELVDRHRRAVTGVGPEPAAGPVPRFAEYVALERAAVDDPAARAFWDDMVERFPPVRVPRSVGAAPADKSTCGWYATTRTCATASTRWPPAPGCPARRSCSPPTTT